MQEETKNIYLWFRKMSFMRYILLPFYYLWKIYFGLIFLVTLLLFYPILLFFILSENLKKYTFNINIIWSRCVRILCFYAVHKIGEETDSKVAKVVVANHTSYLDIFLLYSIFPEHRFLFIGKSEILSYPLIKTFFKQLNIPVDRSSKVKSARAFIKARRELINDWSIVIFPEGGIPVDAPRLSTFKDGAFQLAKSSAVSIQPITFENNFYLLSDPEIPRGFARPGLLRVHVHPLISAKEVQQNETAVTKEKIYQMIRSALPKKFR